MKRLWDGAYSLLSLSEKTRESSRRQHFPLSYFKTLSINPAGAWTSGLLFGRTVLNIQLTELTGARLNGTTKLLINGATKYSDQNIDPKVCFFYIVATSSVTSGRSAGVETETVLLETKVRYGEISYNDEDVLQQKDGWRPSERQVSIVMEDLRPYGVRTLKFFRTGDDPAVKISYDKRTLESIFLEGVRRYNDMTRCRKCLCVCHCCLILCCGMFKDCMVTCFLYMARCLGSLWGWCSDRFRGR